MTQNSMNNHTGKGFPDTAQIGSVGRELIQLDKEQEIGYYSRQMNFYRLVANKDTPNRFK